MTCLHSRIFIADHRVVDPYIAAEIAHGAEARVDADAQLKDVFLPPLAPLDLQVAHPLLHRDRHLESRGGVLARAAAFRVAEEQVDLRRQVLRQFGRQRLEHRAVSTSGSS